MAFRAWILGSFAWLSVGCGPAIGDECSNSVDCSAQNNRVCDREQPGGYCTLLGCENDSCPDDAVCVTFRPDPERLSMRWCMATCEDNTDCRKDEGYRCKTAQELNKVNPDEPLVASVPYSPGARFCVVPPQQLMSMPDAGAPNAADEDASAGD